MSISDPEVVLGADIGGTSTRVVVAAVTPVGLGEVLAVARGRAGNPNAVGLDASAGEIAATSNAALDLAAARAGAEPRVCAAVIGMAGYGAVTDPPTFLASALPRVETSLVRVVPDFSIAFASATPAAAGYVVLAGTGSGAVEIAGDEPVVRRDAWGWLLGDLGSGFWIGREAVRSTLGRLERDEPVGHLGAAVLGFAGADSLDALLTATYARPPIWLASLAPTVAETVDTDPEARRISEQAAGLLLEALLSLDPRPGRPVVTTGSVLQHHPVVVQTLLEALAGRLDNPVRHATSGLVGALWIAARSRPDGVIASGPGLLQAESEHARLLAAVTAATPS